MKRLALALAVLALAGCSTGKQKITMSISAWGVEFAPTFETENITFFVDSIIVTNTVCGCEKEIENND